MHAALRGTFLSPLLATVALSAAADLPVEEDGRVHGQLVLEFDTAAAGAFGLAAGEATTFVGEVEIRLDPPPPPDEPLPDGDYSGILTHFDVRIGNTSWDETMLHSDPLVRVVGGAASAVSVDITRPCPATPTCASSCRTRRPASGAAGWPSTRWMASTTGAWRGLRAGGRSGDPGARAAGPRRGGAGDRPRCLPALEASRSRPGKAASRLPARAGAALTGAARCQRGLRDARIEASASTIAARTRSARARTTSRRGPSP